MDENTKKARKMGIVVFLLLLCIALACLGICAYLVITYRGSESVSDGIVDASKILALIGLFFLVVDFGLLLPAMLRQKKANPNKSTSAPNTNRGTADIFDESYMRQILEKYIPQGETLLAGIHAISQETKVIGVFGKCARTTIGFIPDENGGIIALNKKKYSAYDIYIGVTQYSLLVAECEKNSYAYQFDHVQNVNEADVQVVTSNILFDDIGTCFPLSDIQNCAIKNGWLGSVKCLITMKNGSYFKLMLPKYGGVGGGMPHHSEYRESIIAHLREHSA